MWESFVSQASLFRPLFGGREMAELFRRAKEQGILVCADMTKCKNQETTEDIKEALSYLDYLFANQEEANMVTGKESTEEMAEVLYSCGVKNVIIKCGGKGCYVKNASLKRSFPAAEGVRCVDTTGAGDSFAGGFLYALAEGKTFTECVRYGNACGSLAVETVGACTGIINKEQAEKRMECLRIDWHRILSYNMIQIGYNKTAKKAVSSIKRTAESPKRKAEFVMERRNVWLSYTEAEEKEMEKTVSMYRHFLDVGKTERECVTEIIRQAREAGYVSLEEKIAAGEKIKAGDKIYAAGMKKIIVLFHVGTEDIEKGMNILGAHIDSPRLDIKQNPLYEDTDLAYLDTHYYGGVKKYQWVALPLALHGVVAKKDGTVVEVNIGEAEDDPVVYITDLLIHLSGKQLQKKAAEVIEGEKMDILIGSRPLKDVDDEKKKEAVKENVLKILNEKYGIEEEDFLSAELEIVPAGKARECGLDRSMVAAYGQDDRVCAYTLR